MYAWDQSGIFFAVSYLPVGWVLCYGNTWYYMSKPWRSAHMFLCLETNPEQRHVHIYIVLKTTAVMWQFFCRNSGGLVVSCPRMLLVFVVGPGVRVPPVVINTSYQYILIYLPKNERKDQLLRAPVNGVGIFRRNFDASQRGKEGLKYFRSNRGKNARHEPQCAGEKKSLLLRSM